MRTKTETETREVWGIENHKKWVRNEPNHKRNTIYDNVVCESVAVWVCCSVFDVSVIVFIYLDIERRLMSVPVIVIIMPILYLRHIILWIWPA